MLESCWDRETLLLVHREDNAVLLVVRSRIIVTGSVSRIAQSDRSRTARKAEGGETQRQEKNAFHIERDEGDKFR